MASLSTVVLLGSATTGRTIGAQTQRPQIPGPAFEVASIKPNASGDPRQLLDTTSSTRFTARNVPVRTLIYFAYDVQPFLLVGGPQWMATERFDVVAKAEESTPPKRMRLMVQTLLADRYRLQVHSEKRELPVYRLVLARADRRLGPELRQAAADCTDASSPPPTQIGATAVPACGYVGIAPGRSISSGKARMGFRGVSMEAFARFLAGMVGRSVIDRTGLSQVFDGEFDFAAEFGPPPPPPGVADPYDRQSFATIFTVIQEQLGLKLESSNDLVDVLVVDRLERPTPD